MSKAALMRFKNKWGKCIACPLHLTARKHVLYRGTIPAEVFFVGEAPGKTEDRLGEPFVGKSGSVLNSVLDSLRLNNFCIANTVCCIPLLDGDIRQPTKLEVDSCISHVHELVSLCQPKVIISLGEVAKKLLAGVSFQEKTYHLRHPAFILRRGGIGSAEYKKFVLALQMICEDHEIDHQTVYFPESYAKKTTIQE